LAQQIADITHDDPRDFIIHGIARLTPQVAAQLRQAAMAFLGATTRSLVKPDAPSPLSELAKSAVELIARALVSALPPRHTKPSIKRQRQLIRQAEDYVAHFSELPLRIGQLCREIDISERTLREAFYKATDTSPLAYLKTQQLNRVYRILRDVDPDEALIKDVAVANGFTHPGQFSRDYKRLFGELPSETLQRRQLNTRIRS
jgi:AraC family ethanolamine operon transcriptional activator